MGFSAPNFVFLEENLSTRYYNWGGQCTSAHCHDTTVVVVIVVVVQMNPSGNANMGGPVPGRDEEFHMVLVVDKSRVSVSPS